MGNLNCNNCLKKKYDDETTINFPFQQNNYSENDYEQLFKLKSNKFFSTDSSFDKKIIINKTLTKEESNIIKIQSTYRMYSFKKKFELSLKKYLIQKEKNFISEILSLYNTSSFDIISSLNPNYKNPIPNLTSNPKNLKTKLLIKNNSIYIGEVDISNNKNGKGILYTKSGQKFEGNFEENILNGVGRLTDIIDNYTIEGNFKNSKLNGFAKKYSEDYYYEGNFINNKKNGKGKEETEDYIYIGNFENDDKFGEGKVEYKKTKDKYEGDFKDNNITGKGIYIWENGHIFKGNFLNGKMHGFGQYNWPKGGYYIGNYVNGLKEGYGEFHWPNNKVFKGNFKNGKPNGTGILIQDNKEKNVFFKDGVIQGEVLNEKME